MTAVHEENMRAKKCLAMCNTEIQEIDAELNDLVEKLVSGEVTELLVKIREQKLRKRREQAEKIRKAMIGVIKDF